MKTLLLPPLCLVLLALCGFVIRKRRPRLGRSLLITAFSLLWLMSTQYIGAVLLRSLQTEPALTTSSLAGTNKATDRATDKARAILVLAAGVDVEAAEFGGPTIGRLTVQRLRYAARLHRQTGAPILVSGGIGNDLAPPLAQLMARSLKEDFGLKAKWIEDASRTTWENTVFASRILRGAGIRHVYLVTHAWHMPRAVLSCRANDLEPTPAPTGFRAPGVLSFASILPDWKGLRDSSLAMHEMIGWLWYSLAYD